MSIEDTTFPTITVITPSFNQGPYIEETIRSVLSQEGTFTLDYIVMDGASTDNSVDIIRKYDSLLKLGTWRVRCKGIRYRWFSERDKGQSDAINKGISASAGTILGWLNSDDTYLPNALQTVCDAFRNNATCQAVYGRAHYVDEAGAVISPYPTEPFSSSRFAQFNFICQPAAFFTKTAVERVGNPDASLRYAMDYDLWIRIANHYPFLYIPEALATYRLHAASKTVSPGDALANNKECLNVVLKHFHWAPANRVYGYYRQAYNNYVTVPALRIRPIAIPVTLAISLVQYLILNRGVRLDDFKLLSLANLRKL